MPETDPKLSDEENRRIGIALFNATWTLIEKESRTRDEDDAMLHMAHGHAIAGNTEQARAYTEQALAAAEDISEDDERDLVLGDLETIPGQKRFW